MATTTTTLKEVEGAMPIKEELQYIRGLDAQGNPSKTLPSNIDAGKVGGYTVFGDTGIIKTANTVFGVTKQWCRIAKYSIPNFDQATDVAFVVHSSFNDFYGILILQTRGTSYAKAKFLVAHNIDIHKFRFYYNDAKTEVELYVEGGGNYFVSNFQLLYATDRSGAVNMKTIKMYNQNITPPSFTHYENPTILTLQNTSPAMTLEDSVINDELESANRKIADLEARIAALEAKQ